MAVILPPSRKLLQSRKLIFPRSQRSSDPTVTGRLIKRGSGGSGADRHSGELANYLGVLHHLKVPNSPTDKPLEEGLAVVT